MAGIYGVLIKDNKSENIFNSFYNAKFSNIEQQEVTSTEYTFGRSVLDKFTEDRFFYEDNRYIIIFEGINYSSINKPKEFIKSFEKSGVEFIKNLRGVFAGFIFSKEQKTVHVFNDHLASKCIYYYYHPSKGFAFSSEMHVLSKILSENDIEKNYDKDGIYYLALYGQMFDDFTVVKEIKRLEYGSVLKFSLENKKLEKKKYYSINKKIVDQKHEDVIENVNSLMTKAINREWRKDLDNDYKQHITLISGGMDSRVNSLIAHHNGYSKINSYTYGEPNSSDVRIAGKIAKDNFYTHMQFNLNNGDFFYENILEDYIKACDGLTIFTAPAIMVNALSRLNKTNYGLLHTGQIGDVIFGSFLRPNFDIKKNKNKIGLTGFVKHTELLNRIESLDSILDRYDGLDYELYTYEQRQINGTLTGDRVASNFIDHLSPFFDIDLINYMVTVPNKYKINQKIYFDWLKKDHSELLNYEWEKIGLKPNSDFNLKYGSFFKKYINGGKKFFKLKYDSMNPIGVWLSENQKILKSFDKIFENNIVIVDDNQLKEDLIQIYKDDIFEYRNKFTVISVLLSLKLHFS